MAKFKLPLSEGFAALCEKIKTINTTAEQAGSAVAELAEAVNDSLEEVESEFDVLEKRAIYYGTSSTTASTQTKVVALADSDGFALELGRSIRVKFTYAQSCSSQPKLNVNGSGAKAVCRNGTTAGMQYMWSAGEVVDFLYDGTNWIMESGAIATTTYYGRTKLTDSVTSTGTTTAATPNSVKKAYDLASEAKTAAGSVVQTLEFSIPTTAWTEDSTATTGYPYYADVAAEAAAETMGSETVLSVASLAAASGMCPVSETMSGKVRYYAASKPDAAISGLLYLITVKT